MLLGFMVTVSLAWGSPHSSSAPSRQERLPPATQAGPTLAEPWRWLRVGATRGRASRPPPPPQQVALMKQMREEQQRRRLVETKRTREIAQLRKEQRRQEVRVPPGPGPSPHALAPLLTTWAPAGHPRRRGGAWRRVQPHAGGQDGCRHPAWSPCGSKLGLEPHAGQDPACQPQRPACREACRAQPSAPGSSPLLW